MKSTRSLVSSALLIAALFVVPFASVYSVTQDQKVPTKKELVTLLKTAKEPADHLRIAAYYKQEAARLRQEAKQHQDLAAIYEKTHPYQMMESKHGEAFPLGAPHCKKFAELALEQAKEADALAALHEDMARTPGQKQQ
jgi:hypothetical protein